jgi:hypothetical protein
MFNTRVFCFDLLYMFCVFLFPFVMWDTEGLCGIQRAFIGLGLS